MSEFVSKARPLPIINEEPGAKFVRELTEYIAQEVQPAIQESRRLSTTFSPEDLLKKY